MKRTDLQFFICILRLVGCSGGLNTNPTPFGSLVSELLPFRDEQIQEPLCVYLRCCGSMAVQRRSQPVPSGMDALCFYIKYE